jgi:hypothetical protein
MWQLFESNDDIVFHQLSHSITLSRLLIPSLFLFTSLLLQEVQARCKEPSLSNSLTKFQSKKMQNLLVAVNVVVVVEDIVFLGSIR